MLTRVGVKYFGGVFFGTCFFFCDLCGVFFLQLGRSFFCDLCGVFLELGFFFCDLCGFLRHLLQVACL